jgi:hypothetical protein
MVAEVWMAALRRSRQSRRCAAELVSQRRNPIFSVRS